MKNKSIKNSVLIIMFVVLAPIILVGVTELGNFIGGKGNPSVNSPQTVEKTAKVPEETKTTNNNIPKANEDKVVNNLDSNSEGDKTSTTISSIPIAGQNYVVKSGDTLFALLQVHMGKVMHKMV